MHRTSRILALTTLLFAAGAALFFTKAAALPYKVAYPVLLLAVAVFCIRRKKMPKMQKSVPAFTTRN